MDVSTESILDKVISSKKTTEIEQFQAAEVVLVLLKNLHSREEDVLRRRFGLNEKSEETLEQIGKAYNVTRERIRQIESTAIKKLKKLKNFSDLVKPVEDTITSVLEQHGGVMTEESLLGHVLQIAGDNSQNRRAVLFILTELLNEKFNKVKETKQYRSAWKIASTSLHLLDTTIDKLLNIIEQIGKPIQFSELYVEVQKDSFFQEHASQLTEETILSYLEVSQNIDKNPYQEYGLVKWGSITPKRMNDKIYLVIKKFGKPLHFTEITRIINEMKFDNRKAYAPTVHNELILSDKYVLIGRGIYALKEWGYKPGVVVDVLIDILKKEERPMTREELVKKVLEQRVVKKNTIHLALTDKNTFEKHSDGTYTVKLKET